MQTSTSVTPTPRWSGPALPAAAPTSAAALASPSLQAPADQVALSAGAGASTRSARSTSSLVAQFWGRVASCCGRKACATSTAAAAAATPAAAAPTLRIAHDLHAQGFQLLYQRHFWVPFLRSQYKELSAEEFTQQLTATSSRLAVRSARYAPAAVRSTRDLQMLDNYYLGGKQPLTALPDAIGALYRNGYDFSRGVLHHASLGPYGAYVALRQGRAVDAARFGEPADHLRNDSDAQGAAFFRTGYTPQGMAHADEANALVHLQKQTDAELFASNGDRLSAEQGWRVLVEGRESAIFAGADGAPLMPFHASDLPDPGLENRVSTTVADYRAMMTLGLSTSQGRHAWEVLSPAVGNESYRDRVNVLGQALKACSGDADRALQAYMAVAKSLRASDRFADAMDDWCAIRATLPPGSAPPPPPLFPFLGEANRETVATRAFLRLRDHLDEAAPGSAPAADRRHQILQLMQATKRLDTAEALWKSLDNTQRAEQVNALLDLHVMEGGSTAAAQQDLACIKSLRDPNESLCDAVRAFADVRNYAPAHGSASARAAFELMRRHLADGLQPAPSTPLAPLFHSLLERTAHCDQALAQWPNLCASGPSSELAARLSAFLRLHAAEGDNTVAAQRALSAVLALRQPGESIEAATTAYMEVRSHLTPAATVSTPGSFPQLPHWGVSCPDTAAAAEAFTFIRRGLDDSVAGPFTSQQKKDMYLTLLGALHDHKQALHSWYRIVRTSGAADVPRHINAFVSLLALEQGNAREAHRALELICSDRRHGESLSDALTTYTEIRSRLQNPKSGEARAAYKFIRGDLAATLPSGMSTGQGAAMYLRVVDACHSHPRAHKVWTSHIAGRSSAETQDRFELFDAVATADHDADQATTVLDVLDRVRQKNPSKTAKDLLADYNTLRTYVGMDRAFDTPRLLVRVNLSLRDAERAPYLRVQQATRAVEKTDEAWSAMKASKLPLDASAAVMVDSFGATHSMELAVEELSAVGDSIRPGEAITSVLTQLDAIRNALSHDNIGQAGGMLEMMRSSTKPSQEAAFMRILQQAGESNRTAQVWLSLVAMNSEKTLDLRANLLSSLPSEQWDGCAAQMQKALHAIPSGVDVDRATSALLFVAAVPDSNALWTVQNHLCEMPGTDRTASLEWLCGVMTAARGTTGFEQAWSDVHRPGAPGNIVEREELLGHLLDATKRSNDGFCTSIDVLRRLDKVPQARFAEAAQSAVALLGAMQGRAGDAGRAFTYILDARDAGAYANESLDVTLARFATLYGASQSLETALARLEMGGAQSEPGKIETQDGDVVIGGIHLPKSHAVDSSASLALYGMFRGHMAP